MPTSAHPSAYDRIRVYKNSQLIKLLHILGIQKINFSYLHPQLIASHTGTLIFVLIALVRKDSLGAEQRLATGFIGAALPAMAWHSSLRPKIEGTTAPQKFYIYAFTR